MTVVKKILATISGLILLGIILYLVSTEVESSNQSMRFEKDNDSLSISFIMGADRGKSDYYNHATNHFVFDSNEKSDLVINSCKTLACVIEYLNESKSRGDKKWTVVNIVAHGNPDTGLNLNLYDEGPRATPKRLVQAVLQNSLPKINQEVVDSSTKINFWSCGIGKNPMINLSLKKLFQPEGFDSLSVYCSPYFVIFEPIANSSNTQRLNLSYWPYYYKRGYRPSTSEISYAMDQQYAKDSVLWEDGLKLDHLDDDNLFHQEYHIPISYTKIYQDKNDRPDLSTEMAKMNWLSKQSEVNKQLSESNIPKEKFNWQIRKIIYTDKEGNKLPAIKAIGMCTILNFLRRA